MKWKIILVGCLFFAGIVHAQKAELTFDNLKAANSPAFNMLGIANSEIEHPTELSDLMANVKTNSNNFTKIPTNYAVEIAPFLLFRHQLGYKNVTLDRFNSKKFGNVFKQTLDISVGMQQSFTDKTNADSNSRFAFGLKFSLIRPRWTQETEDEYNSIIKEMTKKLTAYTVQLREIKNDDSIYNTYFNAGEFEKANTREDELKSRILIEDIHTKGPVVITRKGLFLDFTSGAVLEYPDNNFDFGFIKKGGVWLTGGYQNIGNRSISAEAIVRYLYSKENNLIKQSVHENIDFGARLVLEDKQTHKYLLSAEGIYRYYVNSLIDPTYRIVANLEYAIAANKRITFSFGRNYEGISTKGGNVIAALNFVKGFGNSKNVDISKK